MITLIFWGLVALVALCALLASLGVLWLGIVDRMYLPIALGLGAVLFTAWLECVSLEKWSDAHDVR